MSRRNTPATWPQRWQGSWVIRTASTQALPPARLAPRADLVAGAHDPAFAAARARPGLVPAATLVAPWPTSLVPVGNRQRPLALVETLPWGGLSGASSADPGGQDADLAAFAAARTQHCRRAPVGAFLAQRTIVGDPADRLVLRAVCAPAQRARVLTLIARLAHRPTVVATDRDRRGAPASRAWFSQMMLAAPLAPSSLRGVRGCQHNFAALAAGFTGQGCAVAGVADSPLRGVLGGLEDTAAPAARLRHPAFGLPAPRTHRCPVPACCDPPCPAAARAGFGTTAIARLAPRTLHCPSCWDGQPAAATARPLLPCAAVAGVALPAAYQGPLAPAPRH